MLMVAAIKLKQDNLIFKILFEILFENVSSLLQSSTLFREMEDLKVQIKTQRASNKCITSLTQSNKKNLQKQYRKCHLKFVNQIQSYIKNQIHNIIQVQVKCLKTKAQMQKDLQLSISKSRINHINSQERLRKFRETEGQKQYQKYKQFITYKTQKQGKIKNILAKRRQMSAQKHLKSQQKFEKVKLKQQQNIKHNQKALKQLQDSLIYSKDLKSFSKKIRISSSSNLSVRGKNQGTEDQNIRISTYLKKMKQAENNVMQKQILRQKNKNRDTKCLIKERQLLEECKTEKIKQKYEIRMQYFQKNLEKIRGQKNSQAANKSLVKSKMQQSALFKKQNIHSAECSKVYTDFERKYKYKKNKLEQRQQIQKRLLQQKFRLKNLCKIKIQDQKLNHQNDMKIVFAKIQHIKNMGSNDNITENQKKQLLKFLDQKDPQYKTIYEFLSSTKNEYAQKKINQEQEKAKLLKSKKSARSKEQFSN